MEAIRDDRTDDVVSRATSMDNDEKRSSARAIASVGDACNERC